MRKLLKNNVHTFILLVDWFFIITALISQLIGVSILQARNLKYSNNIEVKCELSINCITSYNINFFNYLLGYSILIGVFLLGLLIFYAVTVTVLYYSEKQQNTNKQLDSIRKRISEKNVANAV